MDEAAIKAVGDELRALKEKLKAEVGALSQTNCCMHTSPLLGLVVWAVCASSSCFAAHL